MSKLAVVLLVSACASPAIEGTADPTDPPGWTGTVGTPKPRPPDKGPYAVTSTIDLTVEAILPAQAELVVADLREFSTNPAQALIDMATQAGVPALGDLYSLIPGVIKDQLNGWINDALSNIKVGGMPLTAWAGHIADLADAALTQFAVDSQLTLSPMSATHTLTAIDFNPAGLDVVLPIPGLLGDILTQTPTVTIGDGGALALGDQNFGLNYGEYAWDALNLVVAAEFGGDIQTELTDAVNCPNLAADVSNQCVLDVCVGHEQDLEDICSGGIDALVNVVHAKLAAMRFDVLQYATGTATLVDDDGDGVADRITNGVWAAKIDLGQGLRHTPATFVGSR
jgi:hypothetical protein